MAAPEPSDPGLGAPEIGQVLEDRYRLDDRLGEGGVGWVFRAEHLKLGSTVAIKMLQEQFSEHSMMRPRFIREAKALAALKHPHIVTITDFSFSNDRPYIVMELLEGRSLRDVIVQDGPIAPERARRIVVRVLDALSFAHAEGFVHRDLKPDNIFLLELPNDDAFPKLLDFGFVKLTGEVTESASDVLTRSGIAFGTPAYMSPEQATGGDADARSDTYSLGVVLYEMLTGRRPFEGTLPEIVRQHLTAPVPSFGERGAKARETSALRQLFQTSLAKEPEHRFQTAKDMRAAIKGLPEPFMVSSAVPDETVSTEAPTVAAVPQSKRRQQRSGTFRMVGALLVFVGLVGGVAALVAVAAIATEDEAEDLLHAPTASPPIDDPVGEPVVDPPIDPDPEAPPYEFELDPEAEPEVAIDPETAPETAEAPETPETVESAAGLPEPEVVNEGRSPWETRRRVQLLTNTRRRVLRGRPLSSGAERSVKRFVRAHRRDPRPHLIIAQSFMAKGWWTAALERYQLALRIDAASKNDPRMRRDIVRLAGTDSVGERAAEEVVRLYGATALENVNRELERGRIDDETRARLQALRRRLTP